MPRFAPLPAVASSALVPIQVAEKRSVSSAMTGAETAAAASSPPAAESALDQPLLPLVASTQPPVSALSSALSQPSPASRPLPLSLPLPLPPPPPPLLPLPPSPRPSVIHALSASSIALSTASSASSASRHLQCPSPSSFPAPLSLSLRSGHFSMQGLRSEMEDKTVLLPHPLFNSTGQMQDALHRSYFAVFDGHGGDVCAEYCLTEDMEVLTELGFMSPAQVFAACPELVASMAPAALESDVELSFAGTVLRSRAGSLCWTPSPAEEAADKAAAVRHTRLKAYHGPRAVSAEKEALEHVTLQEGGGAARRVSQQFKKSRHAMSDALVEQLPPAASTLDAATSERRSSRSSRSNTAAELRSSGYEGCTTPVYPHPHQQYCDGCSERYAMSEADVPVTPSSRLRFATMDPSTGHLLYLPATVLTVKTVTSLVEFTHAAEAPHWAADADEYGLTPDHRVRMQAHSDRCRDGEKATERFRAEHSSNGVSVIVDPQHDMFVRVGAATADQRTRWESTDYHKVKAGALVSDDVRQRVKMTGRAPAGLAGSADAEELPFAPVLGLKTEEQVTAFLLLYGYWLGDGCLDARDRTVLLCPNKDNDKAWLLDRLAELELTVKSGGIRHSGNDSANGQRMIRIKERRWVDYFFGEYGPKYGAAAATHTGLSTYNIKSVKSFCVWVWRLRRRRARRVLAGLRMADGKEAADRNVIYTSDVGFREEIVRLSLHAGYSARFNLEYRKGAHRGYSAVNGTAIIAQHDGWAVTYTDYEGAADPVLCNHKDIRRCAVPSGETVPVWCVTVPPHNLIITRRVNKNAEGVVTQASRPVVIGNCRQHVHLNFLSEAAFPSRPALAMQRALSRTDAEFCSACRRINLLSSSGTTALCAFLCGRKLVVANIGDSRAVLIRRSAAAGSGGAAAAVVALSSDHKPGRKDEKARIEALGGRVAVSEEDAWAASSSPSCSFLSSCCASSRPLRVFPGGLSVSRTIGDIGVKSLRLVIADAELWEGELTDDDGWIVLACDGVWDVMSNAAVAELVRRWDSLQQQTAVRAAGSGQRKPRSDSARWSELAEVIAKEAFRRGSTDNISVIVVALQWERKAAAHES